MLWIMTDEGKVGLAWRHEPIKVSDIFSHASFCDVVNEAEHLIGSGVAWCSKRDQFCKERGRKLSLARALKDARFDYELRRQVWAGYFTRRTT